MSGPSFFLIGVLAIVGVAALVTAGVLLPRLRARRQRTITLVLLLAILAGAGAGIFAVVRAGAAADAHVAAQESGDAAAESGSGADVALEAAQAATIPDGFTDASQLAPGISVDLRYAGTHNFTGSVVNGYETDNVVWLRDEAAEALARVQERLADEGLGLEVYDAFRPTRAVQFFMDWSKTPDTSTQAEFYPDFEKPQLFELGYIAEKSRHSLGGTVDLTVIDAASGTPLDMGGPFDFFGERSHYDAPGLTAEQRSNREKLQRVMMAEGFEPYDLEWWHFSYPLPADAEALDFPVRAR